MKAVADASVVAKWFVAEDRDELALSWLHSDVDFVAPDLMLMEVANVLSKKAKDGFLSSEQVVRAMASLRSGRLVLRPDRILLDRAIAMSLQLRHAVYDCVYLALAEAENAVLLTDDGKFRTKAMQSGFAGLIANFEGGPRRTGREA